MNALAIREARAADIDLLIPLMKSYWAYDGIPDFEETRIGRQLWEFFSTPAYGCGWVAESSRRVVGYLLTTFIYSFEYGGLMAEVDEFFVVEDFRHQGLGRRLLAVARGALAARGCVNLQMQVAADNAAARAFYSRQGFAEKQGCGLWIAPLDGAGQG